MDGWKKERKGKTVKKEEERHRGVIQTSVSKWLHADSTSLSFIFSFVVSMNCQLQPP